VVAQRALPALRDAGGGPFLITASNAGLSSDTQLVTYSATKAAAVALARLLARDYAAERIRVNALCPGYVDTPFNGPIWEKFGGRDAFIAEAGKQIPRGRMSGPEEVARHVRFLLSDDASFLTGQAFTADWGRDAAVTTRQPVAGRPIHRHRPLSREVGSMLATHAAHTLASLEVGEQWTANRLGAFP
jgi:NAD(P)-dependent dehydrogenase (short-subunit alcohol dehydrogenase family)